MDPGEYQPLPSEVHDFVDGRLSPADERDFQKRMAGNPKLKQQVHTLQGAIALLHALPTREPAAGFEQRVLGRIKTEELAERARRRIRTAPAPLWQHIAQVAAGAVAAAVVLAIVGVPGVFDDKPASPEGGQVALDLQPVTSQPTESDLLPVMGDHFARLQVLRRNVSAIEVFNAGNGADADTQRSLLQLELEMSELGRRAPWLSAEVARMPADRRNEYFAFVESLSRALADVTAEAARSRTDDRAPDLALVRQKLDSVKAPERLARQYYFESRLLDTERAPRLLSAADDASSELALFAVVRKAEYDNDPEGVIAAAEAYIAAYSRGRLVDQAHLAAIHALLKLGRSLDGAALYERHFGEYESDLTPARLSLVKRTLTEVQRKAIAAAMDELRSHRRPWEND